VKALIQNDYGDPAKVLELRDVPAATAGEGEVVIDIEAAVVHMADARTVLGMDGFRKKLPRTPGYEGVGRISSVGPGVEGLAPGLRVFAPIGSGTYREQITAAADDLLPAPEGDPVQVALLSLSPATALQMLQDFVTLEPGDFLLQNAGNSAVGRMVIQLCNEMKLKLINVVKSTPVISELKEIGAGVVLLDTNDLPDRIIAVTQGAPVKLALDAVGGEATARLAECLAEEATLVNYGSMSGEPCHMPADLLGSRGIRLRGINPTRQLARHPPEERKAMFERIGSLVAARRLQARLGATYPLAEFASAFQHALREGDKRFGKIVMRVQEIEAPPAAEPAEDAIPDAAQADEVPAEASEPAVA